MNRSHNAEEAKNAIINAKKFGFLNISVDLIFGLPNQTVCKWEDNYKKAFDLEIQHLSAYCLTVEPNTLLAKQIKKSSSYINLNEDIAISSFKSLMEKCKDYGFKQYEISNYAKDGYESIHNMSYWQKKWYLGIGPSAHSFNGESRQWNINNNAKYINALKNNTKYYIKESLSEKEKYNEYIFTKLRMSSGINKKELYMFSPSIRNYLSKEIKKWTVSGLIIEDIQAYRLSLEGKIQADNISSDLFLI